MRVYCPRCGQPQISEGMKFCSRCGFALDLVSEIVENDGELPSLAQNSGNRRLPTRKAGVVFSIIWLIFWMLFMTSVLAILNLEDLTALTAVFGLFSSIIFLIVSLTLLPKKITYTPKSSKAKPYYSSDVINTPIASQQNAGSLVSGNLQSAREYISPNFRKAPDQESMPISQPSFGSVTEETTKLLEKEKDQ